MRLVVQRVTGAEVTVNGKTVGKISKGLFVLIGFKRGDTEESVSYLSDKLLKLRVMADNAGKMNLSVKDAGGQILAVSQFTLYANTKDGNRPSFIEAEEPREAKRLYEYFVNLLKDGLPPRSPQGRRVETGSFGEYMKINTKLDGPVTIILESQ